MAYDQNLAKRLRTRLGNRKNLEEKTMFGGIGFLINGNLACGVNKDELIVRVSPERYDVLTKQPHTRVFDITGKPMKGWLLVEPEGTNSDTQLDEWIEEGMKFAGSLPKKKKK